MIFPNESKQTISTKKTKQTLIADKDNAAIMCRNYRNY